MCKKCRIEAGDDLSPTVDEAVIDRLVSGDRVRYNSAEFAAAVARLDGYGYSASKVAARLHTSDRNVQRYRAKRRLSA